jgi:hypothetical protein
MRSRNITFEVVSKNNAIEMTDRYFKSETLKKEGERISTLSVLFGIEVESL